MRILSESCAPIMQTAHKLHWHVVQSTKWRWGTSLLWKLASEMTIMQSLATFTLVSGLLQNKRCRECMLFTANLFVFKPIERVGWTGFLWSQAMRASQAWLAFLNLKFHKVLKLSVNTLKLVTWYDIQHFKLNLMFTVHDCSTNCHFFQQSY